MRFNDLLRTVLAHGGEGIAAAVTRWRQCIDLVAQYDVSGAASAYRLNEDESAVIFDVLTSLRPKLGHVKDNAEFTVTLSAVIGAAPPAEVREVIDFARDAGFVARVLLIHDGNGQLKLGQEDRDLYREVERKIGAKWLKGGNYRERLLETGKATFKCRAGSRYLYVDEFGTVRLCSQTREFWGKDLLEYGIDDLREQFHAPKSCADHCTVGCVRSDSSVDEWRAQRGTTKAPVRRLPVL